MHPACAACALLGRTVFWLSVQESSRQLTTTFHVEICHDRSQDSYAWFMLTRATFSVIEPYSRGNSELRSMFRLHMAKLQLFLGHCCRSSILYPPLCNMFTRRSKCESSRLTFHQCCSTASVILRIIPRPNATCLRVWIQYGKPAENKHQHAGYDDVIILIRSDRHPPLLFTARK